MLSANPATFSEGGSLFGAEGVIGKVLEAGTALWDYNGKRTELSPALRLVIGHGNEEFSEIHIEFQSAGNANAIVPSQGEEAFESSYGAAEGSTLTMGMGFDAVTEGKFINKGSKTGMFLASLVSSGFPAAKLDTGNYYEHLAGLVCRFIRQPMPERKDNTPNPENKDQKQKKFPDTVLLVAEILEGLEDAPAAAPAKTTAKATTAAKPAAAKPTTAAAKPAAAPAAAKKPAPAAAADAELDDQLRELVVTALAGAGGTLPKQKLVPIAFAAPDPKLREYGVKRVVQEDFLKADESPWKFENNTLSIAA